MSKKPSFQFYTGDWLKDPKLSMCQPLTRGIWIDLLCAMHENEQSGEIKGTVTQLSRICRCLPEEMSAALSDLSVTKTADVTECNGIVTVRCRRMFEEAKERKQTRERVQRFRSKKEGNEIVTPYSSSSTSFSEENTHINAREYPLKELYEAFPHLELQSGQIGFILSEVKEADKAAWLSTIEIYRQNYNPEKHRYLPDKVGNLLGVFKKQKANLEKQNGIIQPNNNGNHRTQRENKAIAEYQSIERVRNRVSERHSKLRGNDAADS